MTSSSDTNYKQNLVAKNWESHPETLVTNDWEGH